MNKRIIMFLFVVFCMQHIKAQGYKMEGKAIELKDSTMVLLRNVERKLPFDTTYVVNGSFEFKGSVTDNSEMFFIRTTPYNRYLSKRFFVENTNIKVVLNGKEEPSVDISGGVIQNQSNTYEEFIGDLVKAKQVVSNKLRLEKNIEKRRELMKERSSFFSKIKTKKLHYIENHKDEWFTAYLIHELRINLKNEEVKELYGILSKQVKHSKYGKILRNYIDKSIDFTKGTPIKDFTLKDTNGQLISLSAFKGKYVLLDFWGSWCGSCRSKYPEYSRIYEKYKGKGFEIVGVSLDDDEGKWKRAIKKDKTQWTNLIDTSGFLGDIAVTYKVWTVPIAYFIGPDGKVIKPIVFSSFSEEELVQAMELN